MSDRAEAPRLSPTECARLMRDEGYVYLDVRTVAEFSLGHPRGAFNVPFVEQRGDGTELNPSFLAVVQRAFDLESKLVVGCRSGNRSRAAAALLADAGYQVVEQRAGFDGVRDPFGRVREEGWSACGLESTTEPEPGHDYSALSSHSKSVT